MTRRANARVAGVVFIVYIVAGLTSMALSGRALSGAGMAEKFASITGHDATVGIIVLLGFVQAFSAIVLGVTLWAITRDEDRDIAMLGLAFRVGEGVIAGLSIPTLLAVLSLARSVEVNADGANAAHTLASYLLRADVGVPATFFAAGSTMFSWLMLRGRLVPTWMAGLGVGASLVLIVGLPLQLAGFLGGPLAMLMWLPMLVFELVLAVWLIARGVREPAVKPGM
jgi:hypothetical protein